MMKQAKAILAGLLACLLAASLAGCGGTDAPASTPSGGTSSPVSGESTQNSAAAGDITGEATGKASGDTDPAPADPSGSRPAGGSQANPSGSKNTQAPQNGKNTQAVTNAKTTQTRPATLKGTTVQFATWEDVNKTEYGPVITAFTKETGIKVQIVRVTQGDYINKLSGRIAADNSPDVFKENGEFPRMFPLARPVTDSGINPKDAFWDQQATAMNTVNGKVYGVSSKQEMFQARYLVYYNKKLFAEAGIPNPEDYVKAGNWTWDTLLKAANDIKTQQKLDYGAVFSTEAFAAAYGGSFIKFKNGQFVSGLADKTLSDVWRYLLEGQKSGAFLLQGAGGSSHFTDGKAALCINDTYGLKNTGYFTKMKDSDLGFTYLPKKAKADGAYPSSGWIISFGLLKGSRNPEGAGEFLKYYLNMDHYDMSLTYKNEAAKKLAVTLCNTPIGGDSLNLLNGLDKVAGSSGYFRSKVVKTDPAQLQTTLNSLKNVADSTVKKANELMKQAS